MQASTRFPKPNRAAIEAIAAALANIIAHLRIAAQQAPRSADALRLGADGVAVARLELLCITGDLTSLDSAIVEAEALLQVSRKLVSVASSLALIAPGEARELLTLRRATTFASIGVALGAVDDYVTSADDSNPCSVAVHS